MSRLSMSDWGDATIEDRGEDWSALPAILAAGTTGADYRPLWQEVESAIANQDQSVDDIAKELSNPTTALATLNTRLSYQTFDGTLPGAGSRHLTSIQFQPSLPYSVSESSTILLRPAIPVFFDRPVFDAAAGRFDDEGLQLGDIGYDLAYGGTSKSGLITLAGLTGTIPTATHDSNGSNQWSLGPEVLVGVLRKWGLAGVLLTHQWDIASTSSRAVDVNVTAGTYFYALFLSDGWVISSGPTFSYNHEATSGNKLDFPLGIGLNRTIKSGGRPWKLSFEVWYHVESPDSFGPEWTFRFTVGPVVSLPW